MLEQLISQQNAIRVIEEKLNELNSPNFNDLTSWRTSTLRTLSNFLSENDLVFKEIQSYIPLPIGGLSAFDALQIKRYSKLLKSLIEDIRTFGLPKRIEKIQTLNSIPNNQININANINQSNFEITILLNEIEKEFGQEKFQEIKDIIETVKEPETLKEKIKEKLKLFPFDVLSNVIANLITNPQVYQNISKII